MDAREGKLPRWARDELEMLRMRLREAQDRITEPNDGGPEDTNTLARPYAEHPQRLDRDEHVQFQLDENWAHGERFSLIVQVQRRREGSFLEVHGVDGFAVRPQSSNVVQIWPVIR